MGTAANLTNPTGRLAAEHPGLVKAGRAGWAAKGAVYVIAGVLALMIVVRAVGWSSASSADQEASPTGAIKTIAAGSGGKVLLWVLASGMLLYAAWRVVSALMPGGGGAKSWVKRIGFVVSAVVYTMFAFTAISIARSQPTNADGNSKVSTITSRIMDHSAGRLLIGAAGVVVIAVGLYRIGKGAKLDVDDELDLSGMSSPRRAWTRRTGAAGEIGRGVGFGLIGFFLLRAAITFDANEATGLDGALRRLVVNSWGAVVVTVVGIGFAAYGLFCLSTFTRRRLESP